MPVRMTDQQYTCYANLVGSCKPDVRGVPIVFSDAPKT
jgi:hypothetical protein